MTLFDFLIKIKQHYVPPPPASGGLLAAKADKANAIVALSKAVKEASSEASDRPQDQVKKS